MEGRGHIDRMIFDLMQQAAEMGARKALEAVERPSGSEASAEAVATQLDLWKPYTAKEVGAFIGLSQDRVYDIPHDMLRPNYTGPTGASKRYLGINVLMFILNLEPVDTEEIGRRVRERFIEVASADPVSVKRLPGLRGRTRVV